MADSNKKFPGPLAGIAEKRAKRMALRFGQRRLDFASAKTYSTDLDFRKAKRENLFDGVGGSPRRPARPHREEARRK
jgi:hypothetical protein